MGKIDPNPNEWSPNKLRQAVTAGTQDEKIALLKRIGILTESGETSKPSPAWGAVTRTPSFEETTAPSGKSPKAKRKAKARRESVDA